MHSIFWIILVAVVGYSSGLSLEVLADGDDSKLMKFVYEQSNPELAMLLSTAQMSQVQSVWDEGAIPFLPIINTGFMSDSVLKMISSAYIDFKIEKRVVTDPVTQAKSFANEVTECIVQPKEALEFETCIICILEGTKKGDGPENQEIGKGEKVFPNGFPAGVPQTLPIQEIFTDFSNDVRYVHAVKLQVCESPECVPQFLDFTNLPHGSREAAINTELASSGITVSADAYPGGEDEVIIFDADKSGTSDRDLEVNKGLHLLIIPEQGKVKDQNNDGFVDDPDDSANGGTIFLRFDTPYFLESFVFVDKDNKKIPAEARAYDAKFGGNLIKTVPIPDKGNKSIQTIHMNAAGVQRLEVNYKDSGGITNIKLLCKPPRDGEGCTPGYWKQEHHFDSWPDGFEPGDKFGDIFMITSNEKIKTGNQNIKLKDATLLQALKAQGGGLNALARHAVAAMLNAASTANYAFDTDEVKNMVKDAIESGNDNTIESTKDKLAEENERGCPFNGKDDEPKPDPDPKCDDCEKPDVFTVKYNGPNGATVEISKKGKDKVTLPGTFDDGDEIVVDAIALGFKSNKVNPETTYTITNSGSGGTITIHTSCSQLLFVGQEFFANKGTADEIKLTVVSGTLKGNPSIPDASCNLPVQEHPDNLIESAGVENGDDKKSHIINKMISKGSDDAEQRRNGSIQLFDKNDLDLAQKQIGLRFQNIEISQGETITKAYIQFTAEDNNEKQSAGVDIYAQDVDNAKTFSNSKNDITKRDKTSNSVNWFIPKWEKDGDSSQAQRTPDISSLVQEVVNRQGWSSGNSMAFVLISNDYGDRDAFTYDGKPQNAATLHIEYSYSQQSQVTGDTQFLSYTNEAYAETSDDPKTILEANFDSGKDGFRYFDDTFKGTTAPHYADGHRPSSSGFNGGALQVIIGGKDNVDILGMSGGWGQIFTLTQSKDITLSFRYKLTQNQNYEKDEFSQVLVSVDGNLIGQQPNEYVAQLVGDGNGGSQKTTGWTLFEVNIGTLSSGDHDIIIGNFNNKKTYNDESTEILIDDVSIRVAE